MWCNVYWCACRVIVVVDSAIVHQSVCKRFGFVFESVPCVIPDDCARTYHHHQHQSHPHTLKVCPPIAQQIAIITNAHTQRAQINPVDSPIVVKHRPSRLWMCCKCQHNIDRCCNVASSPRVCQRDLCGRRTGVWIVQEIGINKRR